MTIPDRITHWWFYRRPISPANAVVHIVVGVLQLALAAFVMWFDGDVYAGWMWLVTVYGVLLIGLGLIAYLWGRDDAIARRVRLARDIGNWTFGATFLAVGLIAAESSRIATLAVLIGLAIVAVVREVLRARQRRTTSTAV